MAFFKTKLLHKRLTEIEALLEVCQKKLDKAEKERNNAVAGNLKRGRSGISDRDVGTYRAAQKKAFAELRTSLQAELPKIDEEIAQIEQYEQRLV